MVSKMPDHALWAIALDIEMEHVGFSGSDLEPEDLEWLQAVGRKGLANSTFPLTTHQASFKSWYKPPPTDRHYRPIWLEPWTAPKLREIWSKPTITEEMPRPPKRPVFHASSNELPEPPRL